jgi:hypothetical protein
MFLFFFGRGAIFKQRMCTYIYALDVPGAGKLEQVDGLYCLTVMHGLM